MTIEQIDKCLNLFNEKSCLEKQLDALNKIAKRLEAKFSKSDIEYKKFSDLIIEDIAEIYQKFNSVTEEFEKAMIKIITNKEQFNEDLALPKKIEHLKNQLECWDNANKISEIQLSDNRDYSRLVDKAYIDFDALKALTIANIQKQLNALMDEFEKL